MAKTKLYGDRWKIDNEIGSGGQSKVFLVTDTLSSDNSTFALKRLENPNRLERFKTEIEVMKKLNGYPNIVQLIDHAIDNDGDKYATYFVSKYCKLGSLSFEKISNLSLIETLELYAEICAAIGYAHNQGVIHRDIKPDNILLDDDGITPIVIDFGLGFDVGDDSAERQTVTQEQVGSRYFMPPELADGQTDNFSKAADIYCLGKLLYWMFKGRSYERENRIYDVDKDLRLIYENKHAFHFIYERIFEKTIKENPNERFQDANELAKEVKKMIEDIENDARYLDVKLSHKCVFCKKGIYQFMSEERDAPEFKLMAICNNCGNDQSFTTNYSDVKENWKNLDSIYHSPSR
jgi:serine/threonine protein kinase